MASAAGSTSGALLLQYLRLTGWQLDVHSADDGFMAVAERGEMRVAAAAKTRPAVAFLIYEHACGTPRRG